MRSSDGQEKGVLVKDVFCGDYQSPLWRLPVAHDTPAIPRRQMGRGNSMNVGMAPCVCRRWPSTMLWGVCSLVVNASARPNSLKNAQPTERRRKKPAPSGLFRVARCASNEGRPKPRRPRDHMFFGVCRGPRLVTLITAFGMVLRAEFKSRRGNLFAK